MVNKQQARPTPKRPDPEPPRKPTGAPQGRPATAPATSAPAHHPAPAVRRTQGTSVVTDGMNAGQLPAFMRQDIGRGMENIDRADLEVPRLKLIHGISPELQVYDGLRAGHFLHTASEMIFSEPFLAVPIFADKQFILWNPLDNGGGILARTSDGVHWQPANHEFTVKLDKKDGGKTVKWRTADTVDASGLAAWGSMNPDDDDNPRPAATLMYNFLLAFPEHPDQMAAVLTFQRSSKRNGSRLLTKIKTVRGPMFGSVYRFSSFVDTNKSGQDFYNLNATAAGFLTDDRLYEEYKGMHESFSNQGLNIRDLDGARDDGAPDDVTDEAAEPKGRQKY